MHFVGLPQESSLSLDGPVLSQDGQPQKAGSLPQGGSALLQEGQPQQTGSLLQLEPAQDSQLPETSLDSNDSGR